MKNLLTPAFVAILIAASVSQTLSGATWIQAAPLTPPPVRATETSDEAAKAKAAADTASGLEQTLKSYGFGAGLGAIYLGGSAPVSTAVADANGILRVEHKSKVRIGGLLEAHWLFGDRSQQYSQPTVQATRVFSEVPSESGSSRSGVIHDIAWGPTVLAEIGDGGLKSVGLGVLVSFRRFDVSGVRIDSGRLIASLENKAAFNLGIAAMVDPDVKVLGAGLEADKPVPTGQTVHLDTKARVGLAVIFSTQF